MQLPQTFEAVVNPKPKAVVVGCIDPRFRKAFAAFIREVLGLGDDEFVSIKIGGGPTPLAYPMVTKSRCKAMTKQLIFTCEKFPINRVILFSHDGCAYYSQFPCPHQGAGREKNDLPLAGNLAQLVLPGQKVELYHAGFINGETQIGFEKLAISHQVQALPADWTKHCHLVH